MLEAWKCDDGNVSADKVTEELVPIIGAIELSPLLLRLMMDLKLAKTAPSVFHQYRGNRSWTTVPLSDSIPPASLQYDGFGHSPWTSSIVPMMHSTRIWCGKICRAVDSFARKMTGFYRNEADRKAEGLDALNNIVTVVVQYLFRPSLVFGWSR
ncbi:hypothetical protein F5148DRAFT_1365613 [Russula earlei]|uniref:Uncharacterized protein n=1 Tax=Russula earlei TaxID=71964 RepID=A0ACC0UK65_9AGAM|nr:hypothetical protein F5148DRAFT_1365613 [Russula earlei]